MLYVENQRLINYRINELIGKSNKASLIDENNSVKFKEKIKKVEECALAQAIEIKTEKDIDESPLTLADDSKDILDTLDLIESEIDATLDAKNNSEVCLDRMDSLIELKEFILAYKKTNPSDIQLNKFKTELAEKILKLLDKNKITIEDLETFYENLDIQIVKNVMFELKKETSTKEDLILFSNYLDRIESTNEYNQLFELYLGLSHPTEEKNEIMIIKNNYPNAYNKKTSKLITELADLVYKDNATKLGKAKAVIDMLKANTGFPCTVYTLFTKSNGIISLKEKDFNNIDENSSFFNDIIGCITYYGILGHDKMKNLRFLYILNKELGISAPLNLLENPDIEYVYIQKISNPYSLLHGKKYPRLKEVHYETCMAEFNIDKVRSNIIGNYKIVAENSDKILKKIYINRSE